MAAASPSQVGKLKGKALIFNHFENNPNIREENGMNKNRMDCNYFDDTLQNLGLEVEIIENCPHKKIVEKLEEHAKGVQDDDCLFVVVLTHGNKEGLLKAVDKEGYRANELWKPFKNALEGKPKIFILSACRGGAREILVSSDQTGNNDNHNENYMSQAHPVLPNNPDFLIAYSTVEHNVSFRNSHLGSRYIHLLNKAILEMKEPTDFVELLTKVNLELHEKGGEVKRYQTSTFVSFLSKKFIIPIVPVCASGNIRSDTRNGQPSNTSNCKSPGYQGNGNAVAIILYLPMHERTAEMFKEVLENQGFQVDMKLLSSDGDILGKDYLTEYLNGYTNMSGSIVIVLSYLTQIRSNKDSVTLYEDSFLCPKDATAINVPLQNIWIHFTGRRCKQLSGKSKVFFFLDPGTDMVEGDEEYKKEETVKANNHADIFHLFGYGRGTCEAVLEEFEKTQLNEILEISRLAIEKSSPSGLHTYFQSTLRHPYRFST